MSFLFGWFGGFTWIFMVPISLVGFYLLTLAMCFVVAYFISLSVNIEKPIKKPSNFYKFLYHVFLSFLIRFFRIKLVVNGEEKLPEGPCVFIMNHRSNFDPMLLAYRYKKRKVLLISKKANFKAPIAGGVIHRVGYMAIDRDNDREALKTIIRSINYLEQGYSIGIYPEGTRNKVSVNLRPFRHGAFKVATKANVPIVVTTIHDTQKVHKNFPWKGTKVTLDILDVLTPDRYEGKSTAEISDEVFSVMQKSIDEYEAANDRFGSTPTESVNNAS